MLVTLIAATWYRLPKCKLHAGQLPEFLLSVHVFRLPSMAFSPFTLALLYDGSILAARPLRSSQRPFLHAVEHVLCRPSHAQGSHASTDRKAEKNANQVQIICQPRQRILLPAICNLMIIIIYTGPMCDVARVRTEYS